MRVIIKKAGAEDVPAIHSITIEAFTRYANDLGLPQQVDALKETYDSIKKDLDNMIVLVAWLDGSIIGAIRCEHMAPANEGYISRFGVSPKACNMGVGKLLIKAIENEAMDMGITCLSLHTASKMNSLVQFYYSLGFYIHSTTEDRGYIRAYFRKELSKSTKITD